MPGKRAMIKKRKTGETIVAVSTAVGEGGIAIVRLSGGSAVRVCDTIFNSPKGVKIGDCASHTIHYGHIINDKTGELIDEVLVSVMKAPKTYTSEDVVEINCHGGAVVAGNIVELCVHNGARVAEPGEFTKRAFLNGKIDLVQAEAVLDIIQSRTNAAQKMASRNLKGLMSKELNTFREKILDIISLIELSIDFVEEDIDDAGDKEIYKRLEEMTDKMGSLIDSYAKGVKIRSGVNVVICGRPNVGKSSLMNVLLRDNRVIVTSVAGTTRDIVEETVNIKGLEIRLFDTAGISQTDDYIGTEGVKKATEAAREADLLLFVLDASCKITRDDVSIYNRLNRDNTILVLNKIDLPKAFSGEDLESEFGTKNHVEISALRHTGINVLEEAVFKKLMSEGERLDEENILLANLRHKALLEKARGHINRGLLDIKGNAYGELVSEELKEALLCIDKITGHTFDDDILDNIFANFCIGK